jgi:hypothetical protein
MSQQPYDNESAAPMPHEWARAFFSAQEYNDILAAEDKIFEEWLLGDNSHEADDESLATSHVEVSQQERPLIPSSDVNTLQDILDSNIPEIVHVDAEAHLRRRKYIALTAACILLPTAVGVGAFAARRIYEGAPAVQIHNLHLKNLLQSQATDVQPNATSITLPQGQNSTKIA